MVWIAERKFRVNNRRCPALKYKSRHTQWLSSTVWARTHSAHAHTVCVHTCCKHGRKQTDTHWHRCAGRYLATHGHEHMDTKGHKQAGAHRDRTNTIHYNSSEVGSDAVKKCFNLIFKYGALLVFFTFYIYTPHFQNRFFTPVFYAFERKYRFYYFASSQLHTTFPSSKYWFRCIYHGQQAERGETT